MTQRPVMRKTGWADLAVPFVIIAIASYVLLRSSYDSLPPLQFVLPIPLAALAAVEFVAARRVRAAVRHEPDAKPITAINIARCVALGKASALVGAAVAGAVVGLLVRLLPDVGTVDAAAHDAAVGIVVMVVSIVLVGCALVLERSGIDPNNDRGSGAPDARGDVPGR